MKLPVAIMAICMGVVSACASTADGAKRSAPSLLGQWGGPHVALTVTTTGGELEFDCARGEITQPIRPDPSGNFSAAGLYMPEHGGPVRPSDDHAGQPAVYQGRLSNDHLSLRIRVGADAFGPFELQRGRIGEVTKCR